MTTVSNLRLLDVDQLADECADHTERFFNRLEYDPSYCYELFRRAIVDRNGYAWEKIYCQYQPLVASWVSHHSKFSVAGEQVEYFVNCAFEKMWWAVDAKKFKKFDNVAGLLRYLQTCVHSVIVDHVRSVQINAVSLDVIAHPLSEDLPTIEKRVADRLERQRFWRIVVDLIRNEQEFIVLRSSFLYDLKPAKIHAAHPDQFKSVGEVYQIKRNLLNRLRRSPMMQQFFNDRSQ